MDLQEFHNLLSSSEDEDHGEQSSQNLNIFGPLSSVSFTSKIRVGMPAELSPTSLMPFLLGHHNNNIYGVMELTTDTTFFHDTIKTKEYGENIVLCITGIPDRMIPTELLRFFQPENESIEIIRFYKQMIRSNTTPNPALSNQSSSNYHKNRYLAVFIIKGWHTAKEIQSKYHQLNLSSILDARCEVYFACACHIVKSASVPSSMSCCAGSEEDEDSDSNFEYITLPSLRGLIDDYGAHTLTADDSSTFLSEAALQIENDEKCAVCLGSIARISGAESDTIHSRPRGASIGDALDQDGSIVILCCSHKFHFHCLLGLNRPQCPVCRFQHDDTSASSGSVACCTICNQEQHENQLRRSLVVKSLDDDSSNMESTDIWLCLLCGFTGCGGSRRNHILLHFHDTSHTYALNTTNQSVWDFSGEGYVHRLALESNLCDGENETLTAAVQPKSKLTEVDGYRGPLAPTIPRDPHGRGERSQIAPLSDRQERELMSCKQDQIFTHYNQVLQWRLKENSLFYESKIKQIWDSVEYRKPSGKISAIKQQGQKGTKSDFGEAAPRVMARENNEGVSELYQSPLTKIEISRSLLDNIKQSLQTEKRKLVKQCELLKEKIRQAKKENEVGKSLHGALTKNLVVMKQRVAEKKEKYREMERTFSSAVPSLEAKVQDLMQQLDNVSDPSGLSSSTSIGSSSATATGED